MTLDKGAVTRLENDKTRAAQMSMPHNKAAQAALRKQTREVNGPRNPVGSGPQSAQGSIVQNLAPQRQVPVPEGGPQLPPDPEFDPAIFKEDMEDNIVGQIRTQQFLSSPRVKDAQTSIQLKEFFNQHNPNRKPDPRDLMDRVVSRIGVSYEKPA
jgi:hypothetical protein